MLNIIQGKIKKKRQILFVFALLISITIQAKSMRDIWLSMPDFLFPCFNIDIRSKMIDSIDSHDKIEVKNLLSENSSIEDLSDKFISVKISESSTLQMRILPTSSDSILCVVKTFLGPEAESEIHFYTLKWNEIIMSNRLLNNKSREDIRSFFKIKLDANFDDKFLQLKQMMGSMIISLSLSKDDDSILLFLSSPMLSKEEKLDVNSLILQRKLNWNGEMFN